MKALIALLTSVFFCGCCFCCGGGGGGSGAGFGDLFSIIGEGKIMMEALDAQDPLMCGEIGTSNMRYKCYQLVGQSLDGLSECGKIYDDYGKSYCYAGYAISAGTPAACDTLGEDFSDLCRWVYSNPDWDVNTY
ncbi:MAG TPA: hypothetical protein ENN13_04360, partial [Candidatus Altiarchaeales archaeon]|nr:hypothetical protein [Candidatus Altiarchaeales archaeon]